MENDDFFVPFAKKWYSKSPRLEDKKVFKMSHLGIQEVLLELEEFLYPPLNQVISEIDKIVISIYKLYF